MTHVCRNCQRAFATELELELHRDVCADGELFCERCGERFPERRATQDGWRFSCPTPDCDGEAIDEDIHQVADFRLVSR
ncbi:transcriptional regulator [Halobacteriales archaeon QS_4_69_34]|nr:MAG: transcriptional regulator [Halobacteriales archaeon QS_4_69_34]